MNTLIVGDIHGCREELLDLLHCAGLSEGDRLVAVGDAIHRGPESAGTLEFLRSRPNTACLMGNHERRHVRAVGRPGKFTPAMDKLRRELGGGYREAVRWMADLPRLLELPEAVVAHAAIEPGVGLDEQDERVLVGTVRGEERLRKRLRRPWWELVDLDRPVIVGHRDFRGDGKPFVHKDRVFGIDTGCVRGGRLTGLLLPSFKLISVKARPHGGRGDGRGGTHAGGRRTRGRRLAADSSGLVLTRSADIAGATASAAKPGRLAVLLAGVREAADELCRTVRREHRRIWERVCGRLADAASAARDDLRFLYGTAVGDHPLRRLLCLERDGRLSADGLLRGPDGPVRTPRELFDLLRTARAGK